MFQNNLVGNMVHLGIDGVGCMAIDGQVNAKR